MGTKHANPGKKRKYVKKNKTHWENYKGNFHLAGTGRKKKATKKKAINKAELLKARTGYTDAVVVPFEIEAAPPSYRLNPDLMHTLKRVEATIKLMKPGEAFVVPSKSRHSIKKMIEEKWPDLLFRYSKIKDNPAMMRIYFLKQS